MNVIVIHESDLRENEQSVIGVADSVWRAEMIMEKYYGSYKEIERDNIQDFNMEYVAIIEVPDHTGKLYKVKILLEWFEVNDV